MLQSPGIDTKEISLVSTVTRSSTGRAAMVGKFEWGPVMKIFQITSEIDLVDRVGQPSDSTAEHFFSASNFLQYGNDLRLIRVVDKDTAKNASAITNFIDYKIDSAGSSYQLGGKVELTYTDSQGSKVISTGQITEIGDQGEIKKIFIPSAPVVAKATEIGEYPALSAAWDIVLPSVGVNGDVSLSGIIADSNVYFPNEDQASDIIIGSKFATLSKKFGLPLIAAKYPGTIANNLELRIVSYKDFKANRGNIDLIKYPSGEKVTFNLRSYLEFGPQTEDQFAYIILRDGVLVESKVLSLKRGVKDMYGSNIYAQDFFENGGSAFIHGVTDGWDKDFSGVLQLSGGTSGNASVTAGDYTLAWDMFSDREQLYVNLLIAGNVAGDGEVIASEVQKYVAQYVADVRKDCLAFISPPREFVVNKFSADAIEAIVSWRNGVTTSGTPVEANFNVDTTYASIDGNYKYQYDKYNDVNRWIPLAGDIAGLCVNTDTVAQPWMSPAGFNRGQISGVIKLAVETRQTQRDSLYELGINPIVGFPGKGFILYGDKTATQSPSPQNRINVRRLFNLVKKSVSDRANYELFELNDEFTRSSFRSEVTAYLDTIKTLGGLYDFRVVCDASNNTAAIIDANQFVCSIYLKPSKSINYITLNLVATATGADFDELIGSAQV